MSVPQSPHPSESVLRAFALGKLDPDAAVNAVNHHLEACSDCRRRAAEIAPDSFVGRFQEAQEGHHSTFGQSLLGAAQVKKATKPAPTAESLPPGLAVHPDYTVLRELGRGGMGVVYLAHNALMGRDEVLKVMGRQIMERPGVLDRFLREIRAVARLRHLNIVTAYAAFRLDESIVFSMEYVEGLDLSKLVKAKGPLPIAHACHFIQQSALGLQHAHEAGLVHRDIKPHNLMLSRTGDRAVVKVLDFGLAKATREEKIDSALTSAGQALGTPDFIAPEQILDAQSADIRADIYSLGGTLFYLLTGRPPFKANSLYDLYQAHISRDIDPLNLIRTEVSAELAALVAKMMAKDPKRRFQTPGEVAQALVPFGKKTGTGVGKPVSVVSTFGQSRAVSSPPPPQPATPAEPIVRTANLPAPDALWENLVDALEPESLPLPARLAHSSSKRPWRVLTAVVGAGFLVLLLGIIIKITLDRNGVSLEIMRPSVASAVSDAKDVAADKGDDAPAPNVTAPVVSGPEGQNWVSLFNGRDKTGWKTDPSQPGNWHVENGVLIGSGPALSHFYTERSDFNDFHLKVEARYREGGSGAVMFRAGFGPEIPTEAPKYPVGFHATINSRHAFRGNTGGIFNARVPENEWIADYKGTPVPSGEWFLLEILASNNIAEVFVNSRQSAYFQFAPAARMSGHVVLQQLTPDRAIEFRSIAIRELDFQKAGTREVARLTGHSRRINTVTFSPDSQRVLTGGNGFQLHGTGPDRWESPRTGDATVRLWDASNGRELHSFPGHFPYTHVVVFSGDGKLAASTGGWHDFQHMDVYDLTVGRRIHEFQQPKRASSATALTFSSDGRQLLAASREGMIQTWNLETGHELPVVRLKAGKPNPDEFPGLRFMSDETRLITGNQTGEVEIWSVTTRGRLNLFTGHAGTVHSLRCSADDRLILSGGQDNTVRLWDVASGKQLQLLKCSEDGLNSLALSPNGRRALTGGRYGTIHLWDLANGREIAQLEGHTMRVASLAFSADGQRAVSGSDDKTARVWKLPTAAE
jgi:serine/threonine protein kinase/WD40 repeat protein